MLKCNEGRRSDCDTQRPDRVGCRPFCNFKYLHHVLIGDMRQTPMPSLPRPLKIPFVLSKSIALLSATTVTKGATSGSQRPGRHSASRSIIRTATGTFRTSHLISCVQALSDMLVKMPSTGQCLHDTALRGGRGMPNCDYALLQRCALPSALLCQNQAWWAVVISLTTTPTLSLSLA
jgi:hypothetical protein